MLTDPDRKTGQMNDGEIITSNINAYLVARHDSTSSAITGLMYHVLLHAEVDLLHAGREGDLPLNPPAQSFTKCSPTDHDVSLGKYRSQPAAPCTSWSGRFTTIRTIGGAVHVQAGAIRGR